MLMTGFRLFAKGMFVDGVTYAAVSGNLANGLGSFWEPHLSATLYPQFHEHPPLAFGLEGMVFRIFGDNYLVERFYSLAMMIITGYLIVLIWKELTGEKKSGWIPLLFWILFPLVSWAAASNLLDNTLGVFTTLSILLILKSYFRKRPFLLIFAGLSLFAGLLTKGPFALFPLVLPVLLELYPSRFSFKNAASRTLILILSTLVPLILLLTLSTEARESLHTYWLNQVVSSLSGVKTVSSRFYIIGTLIFQLLLPFVVAGAIILWFRSSLNRVKVRTILNPVVILILLGLCGVLPIMISQKQSSFYLLSALPVFALVLALPVWALTGERLAMENISKRAKRMVQWGAITLLIISLVLPPIMAGNSQRDKKELEMINDFSTLIPRGTTIRVNNTLFTDWSLQSYFARLYNISLDANPNPSSTYFLISESDLPVPADPGPWKLIRTKNGYRLFKK